MFPLWEVEASNEDGVGLLVAFGDEIVKVLIGRWPLGFKAKVIDEEEWQESEGPESVLGLRPGRTRDLVGAIGLAPLADSEANRITKSKSRVMRLATKVLI
jgi:hypothetical protein